MSSVQTVSVPHLEATAGCQMSDPYEPSKQSVILVNSFTASSELYRAQLDNTELTSKMKLLAIEPFGHGKTRTPYQSFTYRDTAIMNLQVMEALGIKKAFVLGISQGGWITAGMALLAPEKIQGIIPIATSMDYESERTRNLGCWTGVDSCSGPSDQWTTTRTTPD